uniref:Uncharacterized protein n=1 Tax=Anguilla anguilla TaxID=7936 RepID=A0A0E9UNJ6_ANGAN
MASQYMWGRLTALSTEFRLKQIYKVNFGQYCTTSLQVFHPR